MSLALLVVIVTQVIYSISDFMGRYYMSRHGFHPAAFFSWWFLWYQLIRQVAMIGQLYVFACMPLGKTMALLGASSIIISNALGFLFLKELLSPTAYAGVALATIAILMLAFR
jgi:hypothetical protein